MQVMYFSDMFIQNPVKRNPAKEFPSQQKSDDVNDIIET